MTLFSRKKAGRFSAEEAALVSADNENSRQKDADKYIIGGKKQCQEDSDSDEKYGKSVEFLISYNPYFVQLGEWWKQLFGESEGKDKKGLLPASLTFTTDLHSMGQFVQDGSKIFFETTIMTKKKRRRVSLPYINEDLDGLNYLAGRDLNDITIKAFEGVVKAHKEEGHNDNIVIEINEMSPYYLGYLFYFFMKSCAMSAYLNGVNPFSQPGVEVYKKNMFSLLKKPE